MKSLLYYRSLQFTFPAKEEPKWGPQIDRWYQLDACAYGLAETYFKLALPGEIPPDFIYLASSGASNLTDFQFARTGGSSPSKFVHTLPNIRGSSLCQLMGWRGPLLCIQNDPRTQVTALREAMELWEHTGQRAWVWSVTGDNKVHWFSVGKELEFKQEEGTIFEVRKVVECAESAASSDGSFQDWLKGKAGSFQLPGNYQISYAVRGALPQSSN